MSDLGVIDNANVWIEDGRVSKIARHDLTGQSEKSARDGFMVYVGSEVFGIKWRNWKMMFQEVERGTDERKTFDFPRFFNLYNDPKEEYPLTKATAGHFWVRWPMAEILKAHAQSLEKEPPIAAGTPDPYTPPN